MPPNTNQSSPDYGFIMQNGQKPPRQEFSLPRLNLPRPFKIFLLIIAGLILITALLSLRGSGQNNSPLVNLAARQHEILRVSTLANSKIQDQQAKNLVVSVMVIFNSEQRQSAKYLKTSTADSRFSKYLNKNIDAELNTASQNNNYDATYLTYLKQSLNVYIQQIQNAQKTAPASAASLLQADLSDAQTLLAAPALKNL